MVLVSLITIVCISYGSEHALIVLTTSYNKQQPGASVNKGHHVSSVAESLFGAAHRIDIALMLVLRKQFRRIHPWEFLR